MNEEALSPTRILDAAEAIFRRYGLAKATVVDVARVLGVSHGSVYRHFASKADLCEAVTARWLAQITVPLEAVLVNDCPAPEQLRQWLDILFTYKRKSAYDDPELFSIYLTLIFEARTATIAHMNGLAEQLSRIVARGVGRGEFNAPDPVTTGRAILNVTTRYYHPAHSREWIEPGIDAGFEGVWNIIMWGLSQGPKEKGGPQQNI